MCGLRFAKFCSLVAGVFLFSMVAFSTPCAFAALNNGYLEIGETRVVGDKATVPITICNVSGLASGTFTVTTPTGDGLLSLEGIEFTENFGGGAASLFVCYPTSSNNDLEINFASTSTQNVNLKTAVVLGYISYKISPVMQRGQSTELKLSGVKFKNARGNDISIATYDGAVQKNFMIGDPLGIDKITSMSASRILQHVSGQAPITDPGAFQAADVDADGEVGLADAVLVLRHLVGLNPSFFTVKTDSRLPNAIKGEDYSVTLATAYGSPPYKWARVRGSLPGGLKLDTETGCIYGKVTRNGDSTFTISVINRENIKVEKEFSLAVTDTGIIEVQKLDTITVKIGTTPVLPTQVEVTYNDKTKGYENVTWGNVDTSILGEKTISGQIANTGLTITAEIIVVEQDYIKNVRIQGYLVIGIYVYTIHVDVTDDVYLLKIENDSMHYEGNNQFSLATTKLIIGRDVSIKAFDKFGNLLESRREPVTITN